MLGPQSKSIERSGDRATALSFSGALLQRENSRSIPGILLAIGGKLPGN